MGLVSVNFEKISSRRREKIEVQERGGVCSEVRTERREFSTSMKNTTGRKEKNDRKGWGSSGQSLNVIVGGEGGETFFCKKIWGAPAKGGRRAGKAWLANWTGSPRSKAIERPL